MSDTTQEEFANFGGGATEETADDQQAPTTPEPAADENQQAQQTQESAPADPNQPQEPADQSADQGQAPQTQPEFDVQQYITNSDITKPIFEYTPPAVDPNQPQQPQEPELPWYEQQEKQTKEELDNIRQTLRTPLEQAYQAIQAGQDPNEALSLAAQQVDQMVANEEKTRQQKLMHEYFERSEKGKTSEAEKMQMQAASQANISGLLNTHFKGDTKAFETVMYDPRYGGALINFMFDHETGGKHPPGEVRGKKLSEWFTEKSANGEWLSMMAEASRGIAMAKRFPQIRDDLQRKWATDHKKRTEKIGDQSVARQAAPNMGSSLENWMKSP